MNVVRIATRGSDLALAQARWVAEQIRKNLGRETELVIITTSGDRIQDVPLADIGGKGLFIKEIEEALLGDRADVAIHSAKDLPAEVAPGLELVAFPERVDPRDALVAAEPGATLATLPVGARVGTGSTRRRALLLAHRPDLEIVALRGNVPTRIAKIESEELAGVILACAGLDRLGLGDRISERISTDVLLPAVCQGTLALEAREQDSLGRELAQLNDPKALLASEAERSFLVRIGGDCTTPMAVHLEPLEAGRVRLRGLVTDLDGQRIARAEDEADAGDAAELGRRVADAVLESGGAQILAELERHG